MTGMCFMSHLVRQNVDSMKVIKDEQKLINIHPLGVYFMLPEDKFVKYDDKIEKLNSYKGFTRGIFKFQAVKKAKIFGKALPEALTDSLKDYNMMVRIVDDAEGNFYYALHNVYLDVVVGEYDEERKYVVESAIYAFLTEVCTQNIEHINQLLTALSDTTAPDSPRIDNLKQLLTTFQSALLQRKPDLGTWESLNGLRGRDYSLSAPTILYGMLFEREDVLYDAPFGYESIFDRTRQRLREKGLTQLSDETKLAMKMMWDIIQMEYHTPARAESDRIAQGTIDDKYSGRLRQDQAARFEPKTVPQMSAEIKQILQGQLRDGTERWSWGVEFRVNDKPFPVYFGSKPSTMIYVCTLLRAKVGEKMYLHEFYNNGNGRNCKFQRNRSKEWLERVFHILFPTMNEDYSIWVAKIDKGRGHPLSQGISRARAMVQSRLGSRPDGIYYSMIDTLADENGDSYYGILLEPDSIIVPKEMQPLVDMIDDIIVDSPSRFPREIRE